MNDTYAGEVKERWGNTDVYKEHQAKTADSSTPRPKNSPPGLFS